MFQAFEPVEICDLKFSASSSLSRVNRVMDGLRDWTAGRTPWGW